MNIVKIPCAKIEKLDFNLVRVTYNHEYSIELEDIKELESVYLKLFPDGVIYSIVDTKGRFFNTSTEALKYLANDSKINPRLGGSAVIIDNLPTRLIVRFFISTLKPKYPTKICKNEGEAMVWMNEIMAVESPVEN